MSRYIPQAGDIVFLNFDPAEGSEMKGPRPGFVVSDGRFNGAVGMAYICPISQGGADRARTLGFLVSTMGEGLETQGNIHLHQMKSLDWRARGVSFKEKATKSLLDDVLNRLEVIFNP